MRRLAAAALAGTLLTLVAGCGFPTEDSPSPVAVDEPASFISTPEGAVPRDEQITVWFVRDDALVPASRTVPAPVDAAAAMSGLLSGVSKSETDEGIRSALPDASMVVGADISRGTAIVELAPEFLDIPVGDQVLALAQIVYTLTDLRGVGRVRFTIDETPVVVPLPEGDSTEDSVSRDDFAVLAPD